MCGSINEYKMRFCLSNSTGETFFTNRSYILPLPNTSPKAFTLILFLQPDQSDIDHFIQALKNICLSFDMQACVMVTVGGKLAVVDLVDIVQVVVLSKDNSMLEMIEETKCLLTP